MIRNSEISYYNIDPQGTKSILQHEDTDYFVKKLMDS